MRSPIAILTLLVATLGCDGPDTNAEPDTSREVQLGDSDTSAVVTYDGLVINEIAPNDSPAWFEIYNGTDAAIDLSGVTFAASPDGARAPFPANTIIAARGFTVRLVDAGVGFTLAGALYLYAPDGALLDSATWQDLATGTWGRYPDGVSGFVALTAKTPGGPNSKAGYDIDAPETTDVETVDTTLDTTPLDTLEVDTTPVETVDTSVPETEVITSVAVIINELYYDEPSTDGMYVFTELVGPAGTDLTGWSLVGINGGDGKPYREVDLTGAVIPSSGLLVIATDEALGSTSSVRGFTADIDWQNGGPDAVVLLDPAGNRADAVQYGSKSGFREGEGDNAPNASSGKSLSRTNRIDTNDNSKDFEVLSSPTPGRD